MSRRRQAAASKKPRWWLVRDPAGLLIASFAWIIMAAVLVALWRSISFAAGLLSPLGVLEALWFSGLLGMCLWSHAVVLTTNPGTVPAKLRGFVPGSGDESGSSSGGGDEDEYDVEEVEMPLKEFERQEDDGSLLVFCDECDFYRPSRAMHCSTCERCIILQDHHCPWVNNCVGIGNHKAFLLLLLYVSVASVHAAIFVLGQYVMCDKGLYGCGFQPGQVPGKLGVWIAAAACLFGLFCASMLAMELYSIYLDPIFSVIADQLAARGGSKSKSRLERHLSVVCGTDGFRTSWLLPRPEPRALHELEIVQGFRCDIGDMEIC